MGSELTAPLDGTEHVQQLSLPRLRRSSITTNKLICSARSAEQCQFDSMITIGLLDEASNLARRPQCASADKRGQGCTDKQETVADVMFQSVIRLAVPLSPWLATELDFP
jgi:hypothetical protein